MRLAVYTDYKYSRDSNGTYADRAFALFLTGLASEVDRMTLIGRLSPKPARARYRIPDEISLIGLPFYESLARPWDVLAVLTRSALRFWRLLDEVDTVWLLGPHPMVVVFALLGAMRGRRIRLGVRQDLPQYVRTRHPGNRAFALAADLLEGVNRLMARIWPVVVVGPSLAAEYRRSSRLHELTVSLVRSEHVVSPAVAAERDFSADELVILSVGRIEREKNPLLLADVLALLEADPGRSWRLVVCGEGPLEAALAARAAELGVSDHIELRGYLHFEEVRAQYANSHLLLHVSWTEGMPQVLVEAAAAGLPIVATDVGGVAAALSGRASLVPPGDAGAAADSLRALAEDSALRTHNVEQALAYAREHAIENEVRRLATFFESPGTGWFS